MIMNKLYQDFLEHTNLVDATYKTVFGKIEDVFSKLNSLKILKFGYSLGQENLVIDFTTHTGEISRHVLDVIDNLFRQSYALPRNSETRLLLEFEGNPCEIVAVGNKVEIPVELRFLQQMQLFSFFSGVQCKENFFDQFELLFKFLDLKQPIRSVYSPLKQLFEKKVAIQKVDTGVINPAGAASQALILEELLSQKNKLIAHIEELKHKYDTLVQKKETYINWARFQDSYNSEYLSLSEEYKTLIENRDELLQHISSVDDVLKSIDDTLNTQNGGSDENIEFFKTKKVFLVEKKQLLQSHLQQTEALMHSTKTRLEEVSRLLNPVGLEKFDVKESEQQIMKYQKDLEVLYHDVETLESSISETRKQISTLEKEQLLVENAVDSSLLHTIPTHLSKPDIPISVTTVKNYLRYYFVFYSELLYKEFQESPILESTNLVLHQYFGFDPQFYFSPIPLSYFKNIILIKEG